MRWKGKSSVVGSPLRPLLRNKFLRTQPYTFGRTGGLKNVNCSKRMINGHHRKVAFTRVPGPGARAWCSKIMRHPLFHGPGGQFKCGMPIAECGLRKKGLKSEIRNRDMHLTQVHTTRGSSRYANTPTYWACWSHVHRPDPKFNGPMLFEHQALAPGPQPKHPGNVKLSDPPGRAGGLPQGIYEKSISIEIIPHSPFRIPHLGDYGLHRGRLDGRIGHPPVRESSTPTERREGS